MLTAPHCFRACPAASDAIVRRIDHSQIVLTPAVIFQNSTPDQQTLHALHGFTVTECALQVNTRKLPSETETHGVALRFRQGRSSHHNTHTSSI